MRIVVSPEAASRLEAQVAFLRNAGAADAADWLHMRVMDFLSRHLAHFPHTGRRLEGRDVWEIWIPRTRLVLWYRIETDRVEIATVWHASQDRTGGRP